MKKNEQPVYLMVPRKLIVTWIISYVALLGIIGGAVVWSNQQWCGIVTIFNDTYRETPPTTVAGHKIAVEFVKLSNNFLCE